MGLAGTESVQLQERLLTGPCNGSRQHMAKKTRTLRYWIIRVVLPVVAILIVGVAAANLALPADAAGDGSLKVEFEVPAGAGAVSIAKRLYEEGLIDSPARFKTYLRLQGMTDRLKVGVYSLHNGMPMSEIARILTEGRVQLVALTIPEGWNNRQIGNYLVEKNIIKEQDEFLAITKDKQVLQKYSILDPSTEGYLFPDTYMVPPGYSPRKFQEIMLIRFQEVIAEIIKESGKQVLDAKARRDRILLASIVEREAVKPQERPMMARVFLNRLDKGMRLESCATIQYLFDKPHPRIYDRDLEIKSPYNTYRNKGLPPGPISNPGRAALKAAFAPVENDYLYFVLKPDGSHHFSQTYREHLNAKNKFID